MRSVRIPYKYILHDSINTDIFYDSINTDIFHDSINTNIYFMIL